MLFWQWKIMNWFEWHKKTISSQPQWTIMDLTMDISLLTWRCSWKQMWTLAYRLRPQTPSWSRSKGSDRSGSPRRTRKSHEGTTWSVWAAAGAEGGRNVWPEGDRTEHKSTQWSFSKVADNHNQVLLSSTRFRGDSVTSSQVHILELFLLFNWDVN